MRPLRPLALGIRIAAWILGAFQLLLGLLFWAGSAYDLVPLHILGGFAVTLLLVAAGWVGALLGASRPRVALAFAWALMLPIFGITQAEILPGSLHWIVKLAHLAVGVAAIGQITSLTRTGAPASYTKGAMAGA